MFLKIFLFFYCCSDVENSQTRPCGNRYTVEIIIISPGPVVVKTYHGRGRGRRRARALDVGCTQWCARACVPPQQRKTRNAPAADCPRWPPARLGTGPAPSSSVAAAAAATVGPSRQSFTTRPALRSPASSRHRTHTRTVRPRVHLSRVFVFCPFSAASPHRIRLPFANLSLFAAVNRFARKRPCASNTWTYHTLHVLLYKLNECTRSWTTTTTTTT